MAQKDRFYSPQSGSFPLRALLLSRLMMKVPSFYQDRLGTNIVQGKVEKEGAFCLHRELLRRRCVREAPRLRSFFFSPAVVVACVRSPSPPLANHRFFFKVQNVRWSFGCLLHATSCILVKMRQTTCLRWWPHERTIWASSLFRPRTRAAGCTTRRQR